MKRRLFGVGSLVAVGNVLAAVLQFVLLSTASKVGGMDAVGSVSLALAAASALSIFLTSDCKSLSLTTFSAGAPIYPVISLLGAGTVVALILGGGVEIFGISTLFLPLLIFKLLQAWGDMVGGFWLVDKRVAWLLYSSIAKPIVFCLALIFPSAFGLDDVSTVVWILAASALFLTGVEVVAFFSNISDGFSWPYFKNSLLGSREIRGKFFILALTGLVTYSPQFIVRDIVGAAFGFAAVGLFSVYYQILLVATPVVSAISQVVMGQKSLNFDFVVRSGSIALSVGFISVLIGVACLYFLPQNFIQIIFEGFSPLPTQAALLLGLFAILMYFCVYLGFLSVKLNVPGVQLRSSVFFVSALALCWIFRSSWGELSILLGAIVLSLLGRVIILFLGVWGPLQKLSGRNKPV